MTFIAALFTNIFMMGFCFVYFYIMKGQYPTIYYNNVVANLNTAPLNNVLDGITGWWKSAQLATEDPPNISTGSPKLPGDPDARWPLMDNVGLDHAMLLEFTKLAMRIMQTIGIPMLLIMGPIHCIFGGHPAGEDHLSYLSFGNVVNGSHLYWIHAFIVWGVVYCVCHFVAEAQSRFVDFRFRWLRELPCPRASTILVESIPEEYQSEAKLKQLFKDMFDTEVLSTYIVKAAPQLEAKFEKREALIHEKKKASHKESQGESSAEERQRSVMIDKEIDQLNGEIKALQNEVRTKSAVPGNEYLGSSGFVTFKDTSCVDLALMVQIGDSADEWEISRPPEAKSVIWNDLQQDSSRKGLWMLAGYALTAGLYMLYIPAVIGITQIAELIKLGPFQPLWAAFAPTMGLQFMVAFLPTFLILIFKFFFTLKDEAYSQKLLQNWYFIFQLVFVILVTAIGSSMMQFLETLVESPTQIFPMLAQTMPFATHFYMNYLVLQWTSHFMVLTRYIPLGKFWIFRRVYDDATAREMSEPEDQDYYGIGSRSCRFTINLCIGIIYGTLSPPICLLTWIEFAVCKCVYGYLIPFAEMRKADLGGYFWVQQLRHVYTGTVIYCIVMTGVLLGRASNNGPGIIAAPALVYVLHRAKQFETSSWETLPYKELKIGSKQHKPVQRKEDSGEYIQPFMM